MTARLAEMAGVVIAVAVIGVVAGRCSAPDPAPLPPAVAVAVERHVIESVVDTVTTHRLERDTVAISIRQRASADSQHRAELTASIEKRRADSLERVADAATTARDSAIAYHAALDASRARGDQLDGALAQAGRQLLEASARQAATDTIARVWQVHALRGDSVIAQVLPLAEQRDRCSLLFGLVKCPTRTQAFVGGLLVGATSYAIATGKIKIPIALKF